MAEIFSAIVGFVGALTQIKEYVVTPIKHHFSCVFCYDKLIQTLTVQVQRLDNKRAGLQLQVDAAKRNLEVIEPDVLEWLERVEKIKQDSEKIVGALPEDQNGTCLNGKCPKPKLRYSQSRQAMNLTAAVVELLEKLDKFRTISYPAPPMGIETIPPPSGTQEFESRKHIEEEIMACLRDDTIFMIGVCGMGGVGKTTMAKKICRTASEEKLFDEIVIAVVSQLVDLRKIQKEIAEALGLDLKQETVSIRAGLLHTRLVNTKKVLIVLDDVWERLNLEEIGIPSQNCHRGCKIILTSRIHHVCTEMDSTKILSLAGLHEQEAWVLFRQKAGGTNVDDPDLLDIAKDVAKECKGLPLALVTLGSALRNRSKHLWEDALLQLRCSAPTNIPRVLKDVYRPLQLSYKALESDEARYLFLICCLFPEDSEISLEDLVHYGIGLDIFTNIGNLRQARNRLCGLVEILKSRFLLMDATDIDDEPMVKMHDVVRDMAIWISSQGTEHVFMVSHEMGLSEWPKKDSCENYTCISLTSEDAMVIPECMNCPILEALLMDFDGQILKLPDTFFNRMRGLRLLSIFNCIVPSSSLPLLTQLRVLRLHYCGLEMISLIGELVNLEILSLRYSNIEVLPDEMGALTKLKLLDLTECDNLKKISSGVISRLVQLEELRLLKCPIEWEAGEDKGKERSNVSLGEVFSLRKLNTLEIWIRDPQVIPQDRGQLQKLTSYSVIIGQADETFDKTYMDEKCVIVHVHKRYPWVNSMSILFMGAERLNLAGNGSKDIIELLEMQGFENIKELRISRLGTTDHLATTIQRDIAPIFPVLRRLELSEMDDLEKICDGPPTFGSFSMLEEIELYHMPGLMYLWKCEKLCLPNLKKIKISDCENLKWGFPLPKADSLCQLETIQIRNCPNIEEVFIKDERGSEGGDSDMNIFAHIKFPKLNEMILDCLPKLSTLCKAIDVFEFPSIKTLYIVQVSWNLKMLGSRSDLLNKEVTFIDSKDLRMSQINVFTRLHQLEIGNCFKLRTLFSPNAFRSLINLKELEVRNCLILEEIVEKQKKDEDQKVVIPQLESLILSELPKIRCFCIFKNTLELPSLKEIIIRDCPLMETFAVESSNRTGMTNSIQKFFFCREVSCPNLDKLVLDGIKTASVIFSHEFLISGLEVLEVKDCDEFKSLVGKEDDDSIPRCFISKEVTCNNLWKLVLHGIKTASVIFSHEFPISELQILEVRRCHFKSLAGKEDDDSISRCFISKEVPCSKLKILVLDGLKFASLIFSHEIPVGSLSALETLEVQNCHSLKSLFSPYLFGEITSLQKLVVRKCSMLEVVFAVEEVDDGSWEKKIIKESKFETIELSNLPKLRYFYLGLGSFHLPKWVKIYGITNLEFASRVFFNKEHRGDEDNLRKGCFMLFPSDFSFTREYFYQSTFLVKGLSDVFFHDGWWKVCGRFGIEKLSPNITYEIIFVIMLRKKIVLEIMLVSVITKEKRIEDMSDKPMEKWVEIVAGEFRASSGQYGEIEFSIKNHYPFDQQEGVVVKCVHIRPKEPIE